MKPRFSETRQNGKLLAVCPRCGLGNRLRVMVSAIHFAAAHGLRLAHLWRKDISVMGRILFEDELFGTGFCDFETLFEPIPFFKPFINRGQKIRLLSEHAGLCRQKDLNIVEDLQHAKAPAKKHWMDVNTVMILTSLSLPISDEEKIKLYRKYFLPREQFVKRIDARPEICRGRWLCVHLRKDIRRFSGCKMWLPEEVTQATASILRKQSFERVLVFSDCPDTKQAFLSNRFGKTPVVSVEWDTYDYVENMFLDFLAMARASYILNSGLSSFPREAGLFGGGIPHRDLFFEPETDSV